MARAELGGQGAAIRRGAGAVAEAQLLGMSREAIREGDINYKLNNTYHGGEVTWRQQATQQHLNAG